MTVFLLSGLKMATNYTFYLETATSRQNTRQQRKIKNHIFLETKGFTAKAIDCGKDVTEVLVETGPHFRGKISAEGAEQTCFVAGRPRSANTSYILRIDHERCGSTVNTTAVWTYVVVQENLNILTQSTRRQVSNRKRPGAVCQYSVCVPLNWLDLHSSLCQTSYAITQLSSVSTVATAQ